MKKVNWINVGIVLGATYFLVQFFRPRKKQYALSILEMGNSTSYEGLLSFDEPFLKEWAYASNLRMPTFEYQGKTYMTKGGKAKR